jgi:hypothetical protein
MRNRKQETGNRKPVNGLMEFGGSICQFLISGLLFPVFHSFPAG